MRISNPLWLSLIVVVLMQTVINQLYGITLKSRNSNGNGDVITNSASWEEPQFGVLRPVFKRERNRINRVT